MIVYLDADYARSTAHHIRMKLLKDILFEAGVKKEFYCNMLDTICFEVEKNPRDVIDKGIKWIVSDN